MAIETDWTALIMQEIVASGITRRDVAHTYSVLIGHKDANWRAINDAIIERWSRSGLEWIKREAWKRRGTIEA